MTRTRTLSDSKSDTLLDVLRSYERVMVIMHDNPDPDAIASAWSIAVLIEETIGLPVRVVGGGDIIRAENRHMVDLLQPPIELINRPEIDERTATVLVDCGTEATNHLLTRLGFDPVAIIDHHRNGPNSGRIVPFQDIRIDVAASAAITASYLREQRIDPGPKLATAVLYAIRTETSAYQNHYSELDRAILPWLTELGDPALLAEIENAPLTREYFGDLLLALQSTFVYEDVAVCFLPRAAGAEIVGEIADILIRCEDVHRVLCSAVIGEDLLISARTQPGFGTRVHLLIEALEDLGGAGGHAHRAGGKIVGVGETSDNDTTVADQLRDRWLAICGVRRGSGTRLIPKREIVKNLER